MSNYLAKLHTNQIRFPKADAEAVFTLTPAGTETE